MRGTTVAAAWPGVEDSEPPNQGFPQGSQETQLWLCWGGLVHARKCTIWSHTGSQRKRESLGRAQWAEEEIGSSLPGKLLLCAGHLGPELLATWIGSTPGNHLSLFCGYKGKPVMTWLNGQSQRVWLVLLLYNLLLCVLSHIRVPLWIWFDQVRCSFYYPTCSIISWLGRILHKDTHFMVWSISCNCTDKIWECVQCASLIQRAKCVCDRET